ncbi:MAG: hemolysin III family protein, partial [Scardovia wiggsiae]|nr:hemolysin III family protein [Scardovia wiggsiae]
MKSTDDVRTRTGKKSGQCDSHPGTSKDGDSQDIPEVSSAAVQQVLLARIAKEQAKADAIRARAKAKAARILAKGEYKASVIEQKAQGT